MATFSITGGFEVSYENGELPNIKNDLGTIRHGGTIDETRWAIRRIAESGEHRSHTVVSGINTEAINIQGDFAKGDRVIKLVTDELANVTNDNFSSTSSDSSDLTHSIKQSQSIRGLATKLAIQANAWDKFNATLNAQNFQSGIYSISDGLSVSITGIRTNQATLPTGIHSPVQHVNNTTQNITTNNETFIGTALVTSRVTGVAADVAAISVTVSGFDINGNQQTEVLPAFTINTTGSVTGSLRFDRIESWRLPPHDGSGAFTSLGIADVYSTSLTIAQADDAANPSRANPGEFTFLIGGKTINSGNYKGKNG